MGSPGVGLVATEVLSCCGWEGHRVRTPYLQIAILDSAAQFAKKIKWVALVTVYKSIEITSWPQTERRKQDHDSIPRGVQGWNPAALLASVLSFFGLTHSPVPYEVVTLPPLSSLAPPLHDSRHISF